MNKNNKKLLSKLLTVILSTMMVFSSVLVVKSNIVLAEVGDEETKEIIEAPEVEDKKDDEDFIDDETKKDESTDGEEIANVNSEQIAEQSDDENKASGDEVINKEEANPEIIPETVNESEQKEKTQTEKPIKKMMTSSRPVLGGILDWLIKPKKYSVKFIVGGKEYVPNNASEYKNLESGSKIPEPQDPKGKTIYAWYNRDLDGIILFSIFGKENKWDFDNDTVTENITLYGKVIDESEFSENSKYFDFRVKHIDSLNKPESEYTTGEFAKRDKTDGYVYSYYSYYNKEKYGIIANFLNDLKGLEKYDTTYVDTFKYVMYKNQIITEVVNDLSKIDSTPNDNKQIVDESIVNNFGESYSKYIGNSYRVLQTGYTVEDGKTGYLVEIGDYFDGTAFDLAINEANVGDTIQLLHNIYISKPIEIWADVNLDLNDKTVLMNEDAASTNFIHHLDRIARTSDFIEAKDICANIYVNNAKTKIYNGTLINKHASGVGVLSYSWDSYYNTTLSDLTINVTDSTNKKQTAIEAGYYLKDEFGNIIQLYNGYIDVLSGNYKGYLVNYGDGYVTLNKGEEITNGSNTEILKNQFAFNPLELRSAIKNGVTLRDGCQVWSNGANPYKYYIDSEAVVTVNGTEYPSFNEAFSHITDQANEIRLLKDITLETDINLSSNKTYTINTNGKKLVGGNIKISAGKVTFTGKGYIEADLIVSNGNLNITDGHYKNISKENGATGTITITGGSFTDDVSDFVTGQYICDDNDLPTHPYCVVLAAEKSQVKLYKGNQLLEDDSLYFDKFYSALAAINNGFTEADTIELAREYVVVHDSLNIKKGITIDLNGGTLISDVEFPDPEYEEIATIYVNLPKTETNKVTIKNGFIVNQSDVISDIYGIYCVNENSELLLDDVSFFMRPVDCYQMIGLYNPNVYNTVELKWTLFTNDDLLLNNSNIPVDDHDYSYGTMIYNSGDMVVGDGSEIEIFVSDSSRDITGIENYGSLEVKETSIVTASAKEGSDENSYAIKSKGDVVLNDAKITANSNTGDAYGIYQLVPEVGEKRNIEVNGTNINVSKMAISKKGAYGIYSETAKGTSGTVDITVGPSNAGVSKISVTSKDSACGIQSLGGKVFIKPNQRATIDDNNCTHITVNGTDKCYGIICGYKGTDSKDVSIIGGAEIDLQSSGSKSYCIYSTTNSINANILGGYYKTDANNSLLYGNVIAKGGYYSKDITDYLAKNYKCINLSSPVSFKNAISKDNTYYYEVIGSQCSYSFQVYNDEYLEVKARIKYDPTMLENPNEYGIKIDIQGSINKTQIARISDTPDYKNVDEFIYSFPIPIKNMPDNISISICRFDSLDNIIHTYHITSTYSVRQYYYNMLIPENEHSEAMKDLAAATLNYGAYAQIYFNYLVENLVNDQLASFGYEPSIADYQTDINNEVGFESTPAELEYIMSNREHAINLGESTDLRYLFSLEAGSEINDFVFKCNGNTIEAKVDRYSVDLSKGISGYDSNTTYNIDIYYNGILQKTTPVKNAKYFFSLNSEEDISKYEIKYNGQILTIVPERYYVDIDDISTPDLGEPYDLEIYNSKNQKTYTIVYSPIDYIKKAYEQSNRENNLDLKNLLNALYKYYIVAKQFYY